MNGKNRGFTLVDLLIISAVVLLIVQLMLPAVQMARESSRRTFCQNNLREIGVAMQAHVNATGRFPTGGWGFLWAGDPDRGNAFQQPGGWVYNILPYMEQQALHSFSAGKAGKEKLLGITGMCETPLSVMICPSRRDTVLYPYWEFSSYPMRNTLFLEMAAKCDYAASAGDHYENGPEGPSSLVEGDSDNYAWYDRSLFTGVVFQRSQVTPLQISDGLSHTYFAGEKHLGVDRYKSGFDSGDDQTMYGGYDADNVRWTTNEHGMMLPVKPDVAAVEDSPYRFGSAHPTSCSFVFCDGSVREVNYSVDVEIQRSASNRCDQSP